MYTFRNQAHTFFKHLNEFSQNECPYIMITWIKKYNILVFQKPSLFLSRHCLPEKPTIIFIMIASNTKP